MEILILQIFAMIGLIAASWAIGTAAVSVWTMIQNRRQRNPKTEAAVREVNKAFTDGYHSAEHDNVQLREENSWLVHRNNELLIKLAELEAKKAE